MPTNWEITDLSVATGVEARRAPRLSRLTLLLFAVASACDSSDPAGLGTAMGGGPAITGAPTAGAMSGAAAPVGTGGTGMAGAGSGGGSAPSLSGTGGMASPLGPDAAAGDPAVPDASAPADATAPPDAGQQGDSAGRTLVPDPAWSCGMPDGLLPPEQGTLVLEVEASLKAVLEVGHTPYGERVLAELGDGSVRGPEIEGTLLAGGLDWQVTLDNGVVEVEQTILIRTSDRQSIYLRNCGLAAPGERVVRIAPDFEAATTGRYGWLGERALVGTRELDTAAKTLTMRIYDVSTVPAGADPVIVARPPGAPGQSWECQPATGNQGSVAFTETVGIGASVSVGAGKRGTRSAIPITGGSVTGRLEGAVRAGGADYQLVSGGFNLDARYTLETDDGEIILVRNCGPASTLLPTFETRSDGPYDWLNTGRWLSSSPGIAPGAVIITIYETR